MVTIPLPPIFVVALTPSISLSYMLIADAGSTGTRIYIYSYNSSRPLGSFLEVAHYRINQALSSLYGDSARLNTQLTTLVDFAKQHVPPAQWSVTDISLKATAGLRSLPLFQQEWLIEESRKVLATSPFRFIEKETRVIDGSEEALFDYMAVAATFHSRRGAFGGHCMECLGAADLGGSSQQLSFIVRDDELSQPIIPNNSETKGENVSRNIGSTGNTSYSNDQGICQPDWRVKIEGLPGESYHIFAKSFQNMGLIAAMDTAITNFYRKSLISGETEDGESVEECRGDEVGSEEAQMYCGKPVWEIPDEEKLRPHPCLPPGAFPVYEFMSSGSIEKIEALHGSGNFHECRALVRKVLALPAQVNKCISKLRPRVIIGMDNFPKALEMLNIANNATVSPAEIEAGGRILCSTPWEDVHALFPDFMPYRAQRACFATAYIHSMLTDVLGIDDNDAAFLPVDHLDNQELSWALGAALLGAGATVEAIV